MANFTEILVFFRALAVSPDPLFFYVPVIKEDKKCIGLNKVLWTIAIVSLLVTDIIYLVHFVVKSMIRRDERDDRNDETNTTRWAKWQRQLWFIMLDVLVILPIPQVRETIPTL